MAAVRLLRVVRLPLLLVSWWTRPALCKVALSGSDLGHCGRMPGPMRAAFEGFANDGEFHYEAEKVKQKGFFDPSQPDVRIVGGHEAETRIPWFSLLILGTNNRTQAGGFRCGGVVISAKHIISAGHCFCFEHRMKCRRITHAGEYVLEPMQSPLDVLAMIGLLSEGDLELVSEEQRNLRHLRNIVKVFIHYNFRKIQPYDISLLVMDKPLPDDAQSARVCLPAGLGFPDQRAKGEPEDPVATVVGLGHVMVDSCFTDLGGPSPFQQCKFPFLAQHNSKNSNNVSSAFMQQKCTMALSPPSSFSAVCKQFYERVAALDPVNFPPMYEVEVVTAKTNVSHKCYDVQPHQGWCGTCVISATRGQSGYCSQDEEAPGDLIAEAGRPTATSNWGWCNADCYNLRIKPPQAEYLRMVEVQILGDKTCHRMANSLSVNTSIELCAARKLPVMRPRRFWATTEANSSQLKFTEDKVFNAGKKKPLGWIMGGKDACQGDSGGPMWMHLGRSNATRRAFLVGLVSRGQGCAGINSPGVYTRIKTFIPWINKHTKD